MAKRSLVSELTQEAKSEAQPGEKPKGKRRRPIGVYLKNDVYEALEEIARQNNATNHALIAYAVSEFIRQYRAGKIKIQTETKMTLKTSITR